MRPPMYAVTTTEKEKVTCSRCAKQLGIAPAAKPAPQNLGTCPCCFRKQKTLAGAKMVHHGYNRPGHGYIVGDCFGVKYPRFEDSCEGTVAYRNCLQTVMSQKQEYLTKVENRAVESLLHSYSSYVKDEAGNYIRDHYGMRIEKLVTVEVLKGAAEVGSRYGRIAGSWTPSFEELRESVMSDYRRQVSGLRVHITELEAAIANWKPA